MNSSSSSSRNNNRTTTTMQKMQIQMMQHRRGRSLSSVSVASVGSMKREEEEEEDLALFHDMDKHLHSDRRAHLLNTSEELESRLGNASGNVNGKMNDSPMSKIKTGGRGGGGGGRGGRGVDDLLSVDGDKNDYEWLLTPPETPLFPSIDTKAQGTGLSQRGSSAARPSSALRTLRLSNPHPDSSSKITRGGLTSRQIISSGLNSSVNMASGRSSTLPSTGPASSRPSTPSRSRAPSSSRPSTPTHATVPTSSRPSTPTTRSTIPTSSRPSTPTTRSTIPASRPTMPTSKTLSRPSTPTRRPSTPTLTQSSYGLNRSSVVNNISSVPSRNPPTSRGSSPSPVPRPSPPLVLPDFSLDTPPNLRTTMPQRPSSALRSRPGALSSARPPTEVPNGSSRPRGQSCSPTVTRGRISSDAHSNGRSAFPTSRSRINGTEVTTPVVLGGKVVDKVMSARSTMKGIEDQATTRCNTSTLQSRRPVKPISSPDTSGFGRTISKKSLDMALRHMDIRQSTPSSIRPLTNIPTSSLYSVRLGSTKSKPTNIYESPIATSSSGSSEHSAMVAPYPEGNALDVYDVLKERENILSPLSQQDSILFKGDEQSTNWLHGPENGEDKFDQTLLLQRFEPFDTLTSTTGRGADS